MNFERVVRLPLDMTVIRDRICFFFSSCGYRLVGDGETLIFKRGSTAGSICSFNPSRWLCTAEVEIGSESKAVIYYHVRNDPFENSIARQLWEEEADSLQAYLTSGGSGIIEVKMNTGRVANYVFRLIGLPSGLLLSAVLGVAGGMYIYSYTDVSKITAAAIGIGIFAVLGGVVLVIVRTKRNSKTIS